MCRRHRADNAYLWKLFWGLVLLGFICKYWYVSVPIIGLIVLSAVAAGIRKSKQEQVKALQDKRRREQQAWINHWVPLIDRQADLVKTYSTLDPQIAQAQRKVLEGLTRYGWACVALAKAEAK